MLNNIITLLKSKKGEVSLLISAFSYAFFGVFSRLMGNSLEAFFQAWTRGIIILIIFLLLVFLNRSFKKVHKEDYKWFFLVGLGMALVNAPFFLAAVHLPLGMVLFIFYASNILFSYIFGFLIFKEKLNWQKISSLGFSLLGIILIYMNDLAFSKYNYIFLAIIAALFFTFQSVFSKGISNKYSNEQINIIGHIFVVIINFILFLIFKESFNFNFFDFGWLVNIAFAFVTVIAYITLVYGFKHIEAQKGSIIMLSEMIFVLLLAYVLFHEAPTQSVLIGGLLILIASFIPIILPTPHI